MCIFMFADRGHASVRFKNVMGARAGGEGELR